MEREMIDNLPEAVPLEPGDSDSYKIKTPLAVIVASTKEGGNNNIVWWDTKEREFKIGYGSRKLEFVRAWFEEFFECQYDETIGFEPVVHGWWIALGEMAARCSVCGIIRMTNGADKTGNAVIHGGLFQFCPNCGAKMDLEEEA